jgi:hypothetical protein
MDRVVGIYQCPANSSSCRKRAKGVHLFRLKVSTIIFGTFSVNFAALIIARKVVLTSWQKRFFQNLTSSIQSTPQTEIERLIFI